MSRRAVEAEKEEAVAPDPVFPCTVYRQAGVLIESRMVMSREECDALAADGWNVLFPAIPEVDK